MSSKIKFQTPSGMHDILEEDFVYFDKILDVVKEIANFYHFQRIETPILENAEIFIRGIGLNTDVVEKEMFVFKTKGGDVLTLRPEGTAPIARAFIQHSMQNLPQPVKLWYFGPFFRYERPQLGRHRQFWQFGFETVGEKDPILDAQIIQIFYSILQELKISPVVVKINSIGDRFCRPYYKKVLKSYLISKKESLCADCRRRIVQNPLRVLDCKEEKCQRIVAEAPNILDYLCEECKKHFKEVLEALEELKLPYQLDSKLVRGLDYYTKTVFEIVEESEKGKALGALVGGGRYDGLIKSLGGKETPAVGGAGGVERIVALLKDKFPHLAKKGKKPILFFAQLGPLAKKKALVLLETFRKEKIPVFESLGKDSLKAQLRLASKVNAKYALILGQKEVIEGNIILRDMMTGTQEIIPLEKLIKVIKNKIK
jgi:histidyl-tRNA synthetase